MPTPMKPAQSGASPSRTDDDAAARRQVQLSEAGSEGVARTAQIRHMTFGPFRLDFVAHQLSQGETTMRVGARALAVLRVLLEASGRLVSRAELFERVWPGLKVDDANLKAQVSNLRKALGEHGAMIRAEASLGYRFVGEVTAHYGAEARHAPDYLGPENFWPSDAVPSDAASRLPRRTTRIVGRGELIEAISRELESARLVSLIGPGGVGKTTIAIAVAEQREGAYNDKVRLIDFAPLSDRELVPNAFAAAIGLSSKSPDSLEGLRRLPLDLDMLLVCDNCEHLIDAIALSVDRIMTESASLRMLATSREPLHVKGERIRRLEGLATPPVSERLTAAEALSYPAVQLFADRADDRLETFELNDSDAALASELCRRLDGLPLAIELAATRIGSFGIGGLLKQLEQQFPLLTGQRGGPERHRTLAAMIEWSFDLLPESEQSALCQLAVFSGPFNLESACAVVNAGLQRPDVVEALANLVAKSLVAATIGAGETEYRLLETTRAYCLDRLASSGLGDAVRMRHALYICAVLERGAAEWTRLPAREWATAYGRYLGDLRLALDWLGGRNDDPALYIQLTVAGRLLWNHFSLTEEFRARVTKAVERLEAAGLIRSASEMRLRQSFADTLLWVRGFEPEATASLRRALDIAVEIDNVEFQLRCLRTQSSYHMALAEYAEATAVLERFISIAKSRDPSAVIYGETHLAASDFFAGRLSSARKRLEPYARRSFEDATDPQFARFLFVGEIDARRILTNVHWIMGFPDAAVRGMRAALEMAHKSDHALTLTNALAWGCILFISSGLYEDCARCLAMLEQRVLRDRIAFWRPTLLFCRGALACATQTGSAEGLRQMEQAIVESRAIKLHARLPWFMGVLAEALAKRGDIGRAATTIDEAIDGSRKQNEGWCLPELLRIKAYVSLGVGGAGEAETNLLKSIAAAKAGEMLSWRLRSAIDLARLWRFQSRAGEAKQMLQSVFDEFTEGFTTPDLVLAADLLAAM